MRRVCIPRRQLAWSALLQPEMITASAVAWSRSTNWMSPRWASAASLDMRTPHPSSLCPLGVVSGQARRSEIATRKSATPASDVEQRNG